MNNDSRGTITQTGNVMHANNALIEEVVLQNNNTGYILISYASRGQNQMTFINLLRLNVNRNTVVLDSMGRTMCVCNLRRGMWVDAVFSPAMTRSIPPQSNAFLISARRDPMPATSVTVAPIASVDPARRSFNTGRPNNINTQTRFILSDDALIRDRSGNRIPLSALRPGQIVMILHANFQTASIPPQTTAYYVQLL